MVEKFKNHIDENFPFLKDKKILIAISGGVDSVVLAHLFSELNYTISLAHCNFNLRGKESDLDEHSVKELAKNLNITCFVTSFETAKFAQKNKQSTQIAARNLRYNWFQKLIKEHQYNYVLTAHHADDNLETFLINLTRGTGLKGFTGIPAINGNIVRPLLNFSRQEIVNFAQKNKIHWREDASNASTKYIRNKIRHQVIPVLKEINPNLLATFSNTIENLQESELIINDKMSEVSNDVFQKLDSSSSINISRISIEKINKLSNPKAYLYQLLKEYNFTEWMDVAKLLTAQSGKQIFSKTHRLVKDRDFLLLSKLDSKRGSETIFLVEENKLEIKNPIHLLFKEVDKTSTENKKTIYISKELISFPLFIRKWQEGDYFYPTGMTGKKKLSKYFKDEKLSILEKEQTWLLCNKNNEIIWVIGKRLDRRFISNTAQKPFLKITNN
ncbi:tRNA lysidine(34) synthetase TilS [Polaribacter sp.]|uniref:tRNA lysidine(34) synthetase TilS n=1 Tax=Polaribacter sp. TaxID=1920175 RepID=UPI003EF1EDE9